MPEEKELILLKGMMHLLESLWCFSKVFFSSNLVLKYSKIERDKAIRFTAIL